MKSDPSESSPTSRQSTEPSTPDTASLAESTTVDHSPAGSNETTHSTPTAQSSASPSDGGSIKKGKGGKSESKEEGGAEKGSNLVGKITNLVSTDLGNLVEGRDFPMLLISLPLQIVFCIVFLYKILGWSAIVGMATMISLYPLPGWIASKMQDIQKEKMKIVSHTSASVLSDFNPCDFFYRRTDACKLLLRS